MPRHIASVASTRRQFLYAGVASAAAAWAGVSAAGQPPGPGDRGGTRRERPRRLHGYGPLRPAGPELDLPASFTYAVLSRSGRIMEDGSPAPIAHDGMAAFQAGDGIRLVRNHEDRSPRPVSRCVGRPELAYDLAAPGGTCTLELPSGPAAGVGSEFVSLGGTLANCAGGPTPWGSWLTCEETTEGVEPLEDGRGGWDKPHGYVFEVPSAANGQVAAVPLTALGRFSHEAVAVDPSTGIVYLTEDNGYDSGFYRFLPDSPGALAGGGRLQMLAVEGSPGIDTAFGQPEGEAVAVHWVTIDRPDPPDAGTNSSAVFQQGFAGGGARFKRLEGCWMGQRSVVFTSTEGGNAGLGQVWDYEPGSEVLRLLFESRSADELDGPDNLCLDGRGTGIVICEDGADDNYLRVLSPSGATFDLARSRVGRAEFAGACFSPDGGTLFVNLQEGNDRSIGPAAGMTLAITGPW